VIAFTAIMEKEPASPLSLCKKNLHLHYPPVLCESW